jgi:uncharacterized damage-inducible protein DinB
MQARVNTFKSNMERFISTLAQLSEEAATKAPAEGGWNPAEIGWHVAVTNELLAGALTGAVPLAKPLPPEFTEDPSLFSKIPAKIQTFPQLEPPADVTPKSALEKLRSSSTTVVEGFQSLTEERAKAHIVAMPMGEMSMYQFADFTVAHVTRHQAQLDRTIAAT